MFIQSSYEPADVDEITAEMTRCYLDVGIIFVYTSTVYQKNLFVIRC